MKIVQNKLSNLILAQGYAAVTLWPFIFVRTGVSLSEPLLRHERIHGRQQKEMLLILFYLWYVIEWFVRLPWGNAYRNISFEREAYQNQYNPKYLENRHFWAWTKYLRKR